MYKFNYNYKVIVTNNIERILTLYYLNYDMITDYDLHYEWVIGAITAVSGTKDTNGNVVRLIEKIRFNTPESPAE